MKISLCMIVKDEQKYIEMCLQNALPIVDEVIIVDTGSTDNTLEIIDKLSSDKIHVYNYKWNNSFADARNASISRATGDWILVLDADEKIICNKEELQKLISNTEALAFNIPIYNFVDNKTVLYSDVMIRLYRNENPHYVGEIHEQITLGNVSFLNEKTIDESVVKIFHYGYLVTTFKEKDKINRNIDIIRNQIKKEPRVPFHWYNLGIMYMNEQKAKEAFDAFIKCHELTNNIRYTFHDDLVLRMAECMLFLREYKKCITFMEIALKDSSINRKTDYHYCLGLAYKNIKDFKNATLCFEKCIDMGEAKEGISRQGRGSFLPKIALAEILIGENKISEGVMKYIEGVFDTNNYSKEGLEALKKILVKYKMDNILMELETMLTYSSENDILAQIKEHINSNSLDIAKELIKTYENVLANSPDMYNLKAILAMLEEDFELAYSYVEEGLQLDGNNIDLLYNKAYLNQIYENYKEAYDLYNRVLNVTKEQELIEDIKDRLKELEEILGIQYGIDDNADIIQSEKCDNINELNLLKSEMIQKEEDIKSEKIKVVFFPYKISMWDSLNSIYEACLRDKNCEVHVVPIPYYEISDSDEIYTYEGDKYPENILLTHYSDYNIEEEKPDIVFVHNIYDQYNTITRVNEEYFTINLKKHTNMLVYVPYHIPSLFPPFTKTAVYDLPSINNVDKIILIGDFLKKEALKDGVPASKILVLGSPKIDSLYENLKKEKSYPSEWSKTLKDKKVYLLDTGCLYFVQNPLERVEEITKILNITITNKDTALIWRPHPLTKISIMKYLPQLLPFYENLVENEIKGVNRVYENVIFDDSNDYMNAINASDVLIGKSGSLIGAYLIKGNSIIFLDKAMPEGSVLDEDIFYYFYNDEEPWYKLIDKINNGYDPLKKKREGVASKTFINIDGTSGEKIYQAVKELVASSRN